MEKLKSNKNPEIEQKKFSVVDLLKVGIPRCVISYENTGGNLIINGMELELKRISHWDNLKYFWEKLFPRLIPPESKPKKKKDTTERRYTG